VETPFNYKIEPIVLLDYDKKAGCGGTHRGELLYLGEELPSSMEQWRKWYEALPDIVEQILDVYTLDCISINLDTVQILDKPLMECVSRLDGYPVSLEWTEHMELAVNLPEIMEAGKALDKVRDKHGFQIILDDVFSGEDAFRRQCAVTPDMVKVDAEVFQMTRTNPRIYDLLCSKVRSYEDKDIGTVIEGIERPEDLIAALAMGASWGQGFLWNESAFVSKA
jgi:EAL domain-containing protein (putative c-di-GMP-specific phosphodiesterase class I)